MESIDKLILKYERIGATDRARWLDTIDQKIPPSFKERIKQDDKSIVRELILPSWVTWDLLRNWALASSEEEECTICGNVVDKFIVYKNATICEDCLKNIKFIKQSDLRG